MKILLIRPANPLQSLGLLPHTKPTNLAYLAAYLLEHGFKVKIVDYEIDVYTESYFIELLKREAPDVVGISCITSVIRSGAMMSNVVKSLFPEIVTVVGGAHASALPKQTLREFPSFDYLVYGEGEESLLELCRCIEEGNPIIDVEGLAYRDGAEIIQNPKRNLIEDLDTIPFPARFLLSNKKQKGYSSKGFSNKLNSADLFTARGCSYGCTFCAIQSVFCKRVRFRDLKFVKKELDQLMRDEGVEHIVIADDTFSLDESRAMAICGIFLEAGLRSWNCETRVDKVSKRLLKMMAESGCRKVTFGIESGSQRIRNLINKGFSSQEIEQAVCWAKEVGIEHVEGNFIIGVDPSETSGDIDMTRNMICSLPWTIVSVAVVVPFPGTALYRQMKAKSFLHKDADWNDFEMFGKTPKWHTENFSEKDLIMLQRKLTKEFFLRPSYLLKRLLAFKSWSDMVSWFLAGHAYLQWYFKIRSKGKVL